MKRLLKRPGLYLTLLVVSSGAGCAAIRESDRAQETPPPVQQVQNQPIAAPPAKQANDLNYVAQVVQQVGPAVVRINSSRTVRSPYSQNPIFERFFGDQAPERERVQRGTGSGFITSPDGQVFTNAHVVAGADRVTVILKDGRRFEGKVLGADRVTDVAVVKIDAAKLPTVQMGDSDNLLPGQWAIAIGNPLGLNNTVTQGIISATQRSSADVGVPAERVDFIQTDAAINPGNSGGPLLNAEGQVIGMNTAIIQGAQGLGFAIPIKTVQRAAEQLVAKGRVDHPYIGIQMAELSPELRQEINQSDAGIQVNQDSGVIVLAIAPNSPAARAGIRPGDIITSINGTNIQSPDQVQQQVEAVPLGNTLQMTVGRGGRTQTVTIRPEQLPAREPQQG